MAKTDEQAAGDRENARLALQCIGFPVACFVAGAAIGWMQGAADTLRYMQAEAVARGVAGYDVETGEWKWTVERKVTE